MEQENGTETKMHSLNKHLLNTYYVCSVNGAWDTIVNQTDHSCHFGDSGPVKSALGFALHTLTHLIFTIFMKVAIIMPISQ